MDDALDWLCFHLQSDELPKLFTDVQHRLQENNQDIQTLSVIKAAQEFEMNIDNGANGHGFKDESGHEHIMEETKKEDNFLSVDNMEKNMDVDDVDATIDVNKLDEEAMKRNWLLAQYQYDEEEEGEGEGDDSYQDDHIQSNNGNETNNNNTNNDAKTTMEESENESIRPIFPEEVRLEKLETEIQELKDDVNNEANNYMRSKHEIADLKKQLKNMEKQAKKLRAKVAKKIHEYECTLEQNDKQGEDEEGQNEEEEEEDCGIGLFDILVSSSTPETTISDTLLVKKIDYIFVDIPNGWSGKTPKQMLLEHFRKNKWPKPTYSRMEHTTNGCIIKLKKQLHHDATIYAEEGPFRTMNDAEHYVSTKALYELNPELQIYLMMPPSFRDLWKTWLKEKQEKEDEVKNSIENQRREKVSNLVSYLSKVINQGSTKQNKNNGDVVTEEPTLDNWDDASLDSGDDDMINTTNSKKDQFRRYENIEPTRTGKDLKRKFTQKQLEEGYQKMYKSRKTLPIHNFKQDILNSVKENAVTVLCAETGMLQVDFFIFNQYIVSIFIKTILSNRCWENDSVSSISFRGSAFIRIWRQSKHHLYSTEAYFCFVSSRACC